MVDIERVVSDLRSLLKRIGISNYIEAPAVRGLYCFWHGLTPLYVGSAKSDIRDRMGDHILCKSNGDPGLCGYIGKYDGAVQVVPLPLDIPYDDLLRVERQVIKILKPMFNDQHI